MTGWDNGFCHLHPTIDNLYHRIGHVPWPGCQTELPLLCERYDSIEILYTILSYMSSMQTPLTAWFCSVSKLTHIIHLPNTVSNKKRDRKASTWFCNKNFPPIEASIVKNPFPSAAMIEDTVCSKHCKNRG